MKYIQLMEEKQHEREEGRAEGRTEGRTEGRIEGVIGIVRKKYEKDKPVAEIAELLELEEEWVQSITELLDSEESLTDQQIAEKLINRS